MKRVPLLALAAVAVAATVGAALLVVPVARSAQPSTQPVSQSPVPTAGAPATDPLFVAFEGNLVAGQRVVMGAGGAGVGSACFQCHGLQGGGDGAGGFPRLAGQPAWYLYKQMQNYADGSRPNAIMTPIAVRLSQDERRDVSAYYAAALAGHRAPAASTDAELMQQGASIAAVGSALQGVQSCVGCHGPNGTGMPPDTPYLAGQGAAYLELQLRLWAQGQRSNDMQGVMADVAKRLTPEQRRSVALYFSSVAPPGQP